MLESASIAAWLCEPTIDAMTRVGRAFAHRYEGLEQEVRLAKALHRPAAEVSKLEDHINDVENVAAGLGFPRLRNRKGERFGIGQVMPSATEMIRRILDEEVAYRLLSAVAHGHVWAIQQLGFRQAASAVPSLHGVTLTAFEKHSGTLEGCCFLATRVAKSFALPLWNQCRYFGWDSSRLSALLASVHDEVQAATGIRFWMPTPGSA
jgi:hypothetical protein